MILETHHRAGVRKPKAAGALALAVVLAFPVLATAGPAYAAPKADRVQHAAAPSSNVLTALSNVLGRLLSAPAVAPSVPPPLVSSVSASTVKVTGVACGFRLSGSGFSPAPDTIVTNAHVVAGTRTPQVLRPDGRTLPATVVTFDPVKDIAVLSVPNLGLPSLPFGSAVEGETGGIFGYPQGRTTVEVSPARVVRRVVADVGDIYDRPAAPRRILILSTDIQPGDSGAPLVNGSGQVVGVAFAVANLRRSTAFAVASEDVTPVLARPRAGAVSTGPCIA